MGYTPEMKELIKKVEATRPARVERVKQGIQFPKLSLEESQRRLKTYHPDYKEEGRREFKIGPNKGDGHTYPDEVVDLFEAKSRIDPDIVDLSKPDYETDVLIIGGGGAGTTASLFAQENGMKVIIATKLRHGDANTIMAEGGIQSADSTKDSPYYHYLDIIGGGHFTNKPELVKVLTLDAPLIIQWLESLGMNFDKTPDGEMRLLAGGGTCRKRMHSCGDVTGAEIMRTIRDEARNRRDDITVLEYQPAVEIILDEDGKAAGALLYNMETEEYTIVKAKAVIITTGGCGRLHIQGFATTNHYGATMDGIVMAYRCGVPHCFLYATQYHPTGAAYPEQNVGLLITEKMRTAGAQPVNIDGEEFTFPLEPRDVESANIIRECMDVGKGIPTPVGRIGVWLDTPMIDMLRGEGTVEHDFPAKYIQFKRYGIDISKEPLLVYPTLHYQNGGVEANEWGETKVPGLFVAGEVLGGIHGENRLMGNSLLDINVYGRRAGIRAAEYVKQGITLKKLTLEHVRAYHRELKEAGIETDRISPMLLPDYSNPEVRAKQLTARYFGTLR